MDTTATTTPKKKKFKPAYIILPLVLILGGYYGYGKLMHALHYETTDNAQVESNAVPVLSRIAGYVDSLNISDYQQVQAGQPLLVLDDREYSIAVAQAEADLLQAKADLATAIANVDNINASRRVASANSGVLQSRVDKTAADLRRDEALFADGSITRKQLEETRANAETAQRQLTAGGEQVRQASVQTGSAQAQIKKAEALIATREAALEQAKLKLSYTRISAPASGRIGKKNLEKGQFIQPGQPLFTIVNNETFWIIANFKETQLKNLAIGQGVNIRIDGYPGKTIKGHISSFSEATGARFSLLPPDNATGNFVKVTQRVPVKIEFENTADLKKVLKAGLSAEVEVKVK